MGQKDQLVRSGLIVRSSLHRPLATWLRLDVFPFALCYVAALYVNLFVDLGAFPTLLLFPIVGFFQGLVFLSTHWSVAMRCFITLRRANAVPSATLIRVIPKENKGLAEVCPLEVQTTTSGTSVHFTYQKRKYLYDSSSNQFQKVDYPTSLPLEHYRSHRGIDDIAKAVEKYGKNRFDIPIPTFGELYREHAVAPFFVFQIFCVLLWCLDEYWYYSVFTLFMLLVFEATVVKSRLRNLHQLRNMVLPSRNVHVYRKGKWETIQSDALLPGDLVSITTSGRDDALCPADLLLISGSCVVNEAMLTGESTPLLKESISTLGGAAADASLNTQKEHRIHTLFGGTKIMQVSADPDAKLKVPDGGCLAYVLRTGFETSQGKLMRTILFSTERITANNKESLYFILFLLVFALSASGYVLNKGLEDPDRSRYKLFLECTLIITSVVPPELPMELSLAVNNSLIALARLRVFCTEPFRIPFAGKVDVCCFDKTGTLTSEELILRGLAGMRSDETASYCNKELIPPKDLGKDDKTAFAIAGCHSIVFLEGKVVGDPMETAALKATGWSFTRNDVSVRKGADHRVRIIHRFHFTSELKRMAALISVEGNTTQLYGVMKGAPETVAKFLKHVPSNYEDVYKTYSRKGTRVIAIAYKTVAERSAHELRLITREDIESDLIFGGFLVFECPLKPDSKDAITVLKQASHDVVMITGDNTLTACSVAHELGITTKPVLILTVSETDRSKATWVSIDEKHNYPFNLSNKREWEQLKKSHDFCLSGDSLDFLITQNQLEPVVNHVFVFARASPEQKEHIIVSLRRLGRTTLMCGDGTNDVGALKQAHVGVALLNSDTFVVKKPGQAPGTTSSSSALAQYPAKQTAPKKVVPSKAVPSKVALRRGITQEPQGRPNPPLTLQAQLAQLEAAADETPLVQLGDASIASPFTAKSSSIVPVTHIIRQGRCTLVTTHQMFKILALNCLISAYSLSVLYLDGVKMGDLQATTAGMLIAMCFLFISRSQPLEKLSSQRPTPNLFCPSLFVTILGQFAIHMYCLISTVNASRSEAPHEKKLTAEDEFVPNVLNSAVFLISSCMQVSTFVVNYQGHPFMESILENKPLLYCLSMAGGFTAIAASGLLPFINDWLELVDFSWEFRTYVIGMMFLDLGGTFIFARIVSWVSNKLSKDNTIGP